MNRVGMDCRDPACACACVRVCMCARVRVIRVRRCYTCCMHMIREHDARAGLHPHVCVYVCMFFFLTHLYRLPHLFHRRIMTQLACPHSHHILWCMYVCIDIGRGIDGDGGCWWGYVIIGIVVVTEEIHAGRERTPLTLHKPVTRDMDTAHTTSLQT